MNDLLPVERINVSEISKDNCIIVHDRVLTFWQAVQLRNDLTECINKSQNDLINFLKDNSNHGGMR